MRRSKLSNKSNKRSFKKGTKVHAKNGQDRPMRGGIRL